MSELRRSKRKSVASSVSKNESSTSSKKIKNNIVKQNQSKKCVDSDLSSSDEEINHIIDLPQPRSRIRLSQRDSPPVPDFSSIEKNIFSGISRLSDSDSGSDFEEVPIQPKKVKGGDSESIGKIEIGEGMHTFPKVAEFESEPSTSIIQLSVSSKSKGDDQQEMAVKSDLSSRNGTKRTKVAGKNKNIRLEDDNKKKLGDKTSTNLKKFPAVSMSKSQKTKKKNDDENPIVENIDVSQSPKKRRSVKSCDGPGIALQSGPSRSNKKSNLSNNTKENKSGSKKKPAEIKKELPEKIDSLDVSALLALGEGLHENNESTPSDSDDDWEEVGGADARQHTFPKDGVEITLEMPELFHRRKRRDQMSSVEAEVNRNFNRARRELQILFHKVSVLGWLAHGIFVNNLLSSDYLKAISLSLIPSELFQPAGKSAKKDVQQILKWFAKTIECSEGFPIVDDIKRPKPLLQSLEQQFSRKVARSQKELVLMLVCALRTVGLDARLIVSFQPMALKPPSRDLLPINPKSKLKEEDVKTERADSNKPQNNVETIKKEVDKKGQAKVLQSSSKDISKKTESVIKKISGTILKKDNDQKQKSCSSSHDIEPSKQSPKKTRDLRTRPGRKSYILKSESEESSSEEKPILSPNQRKTDDPKEKDRLKAAAAKRTRGGRIRAQSVNRNSKPSASPKKDNTAKAVTSPKKNCNSPKPSTSSKRDAEDSLSDSDFEPKRKSITPKSANKCGPKQKKTNPKGRGIKVVSSEDELNKTALSNGSDFWAEVYLEVEERWVPIDVISGKVDSLKEILAKTSQPICYVVAFNADSTAKDVTRRYAPKFSQVTAKLRISADWWERSLRPFKPKRTSKEIHEDSEMNLIELDRPIPTKIGECKNHPLYALKRHLLKFEAIYPPDAPTLGFIGNGEAIYARQNVYTLHSREIWIKDAKVVRLGEKPYKIVKARPKWDKVNCKVISDMPLEIFGPWQVEDYVPPAAVDGKVPRNAYGNVELFKPTMLPKGCVHLQVPGLNRVAKKLKIDCAPAVVGFEYHCGGSYPSFDGFVVCEEFVDKLMDAWNREIDESAKRREEKYEKRVYGNWRRLIKGLLIREHLKHRYNFKEEPNNHESGPSQSSVNVEALRSARITENVPPPPTLFPKLMARMKAQKKSSQSTKKKSTTAKPQPVKKNFKAKPRKKKSETSDEEEDTDWDSSSTSQDESEMVLLSDEDSGSDFE